jgi:Kef-type K+ transport system membrane component KefB
MRPLPRLRPAALSAALLLLAAGPLHAAAGGHPVPPELLWIPVVLVAAKLAGTVERWGQPAVLGELLAGVALGNLVLLGIPALEPMRTDEVLAFLAELGVIILLFQIGLESTLGQLRQVGARAAAVAVVGVAVPFALGAYVVGPLLLPGQTAAAYLFMGAALTATSVGITGRVFRDLGRLHLPEAQIVLGAAVIDDVLGLVILAVVSALATAGAVSAGMVAWILGKALLFLVGAVVVGRLAAEPLGALFSRVQSGAGMKLTLALVIALVFAYVAGVIGLAPIVGAFAAGLVLEPVHFRGFLEPAMVADVREELPAMPAEVRERLERRMDHHSHRHVEELVEPLAQLLVPLFFVLTGFMVNLRTLFDLPVLLVALGLTAAAVAGKLLAGAAAGPVRRWMVGWGMVPRGEVGLIFATIGRSLGVVGEEVFSVIVLVVIFTTLMTPPVLGWLLRRAPDESAGERLLA